MRSVQELVVIIEALRNTRDVETSLQGLNQLRRAVGRADGVQVLQTFVEQYESFDMLQQIWDAQLTAQNYHITVTLLLVLSDILRLIKGSNNLHTAAAARASEPQGLDAQGLLLAGAALARGILSRRMKALYFNLSSEARGKATAALTLLEALASQGAEVAGELTRLFNFSLAALPSLARPPRQRKGDLDDDQEDHGGGQTAGKHKFWRQWRSGHELKRPTRAAYVAFALSLLSHADALTRSTLLSTRPFMAGLLNHVAGDPPEVQLQVLRLLRSCVLSSKAGVSSASQAEVLSEPVLLQLSHMAANALLDAKVDEEEGDADSQQAKQASQLAFEMLRRVSTDASHGLSAGTPGVEGQGGPLSWVAVLQGRLASGQKRLLRWMQRLRPAESAAHMDLIMACTAADPSLAVSLLLSFPFPLEPTFSGRWMAHAAVAGELMQQLQALPVGLAARTAWSRAPPKSEGRLMLGLLRCAIPPCLPKPALSRGLQHTSLLVRHGTLCLLARALEATSALLGDIQAASRAAAGDAVATASAAADTWCQVEEAVRSAVRGALPDPQPVLALYTSLEAGSGGVGSCTAAATAAVGTSKGAAAGAAADPALDMGEGSLMNVQGLEVDEDVQEGKDRQGVEGGSSTPGGEHSEQDGLRTEAPNPRKEGLASANPALLSAVLRVLCGWQRALPGALQESNVDVERLVPQDMASLDPQNQVLFLEMLLGESADHPQGRSGAHHHHPPQQHLSSGQQAQHSQRLLGMSPEAGGVAERAPPVLGSAPPRLLPSALLLPVLRLMCATQHSLVRSLAKRWAQARLAAAGVLGSCSGGPAVEGAIWLELLPRDVGSPSAPAVCSFLAEAVMLVQRRPQEFHELAFSAQQEPQLLEGLQKAGGGVQGRQSAAPCSLLALCALRQALRVVVSAKMAADDRAAVAAYVSAALGTLLRQQCQSRGGQMTHPARGFALAALAVLHAEARRAERQGGAAAVSSAQGQPKAKSKKRRENMDARAAGNGCAVGRNVPGLTLPLPPQGHCLQSLVHLLVSEAALTDAELPGTVKAGSGKKKRRVSEAGKAAVIVDLEGGSGMASAGVSIPSTSHAEHAEVIASLDALAQPGAGMEQQPSSAPAQNAGALLPRLLSLPQQAAREAAQKLVHVLGQAQPGGAPPSQLGSSAAPASPRAAHAQRLQAYARLVVAVCLGHNLPLPRCTPPGDSQGQPWEGLPSQAPWQDLLDAAPPTLLMHTLVAACSPAVAGRSGTGGGPRPGGDQGTGAGAAREGVQGPGVGQLLAAIGRGAAQESDKEGGGATAAAAVVAGSLHWLERAEDGFQVQVLFEAMRQAMLQHHAAGARRKGSITPAAAGPPLLLLTSHPQIHDALAGAATPAECTASATGAEPAGRAADAPAGALQTAIACSTAQLLQEMLPTADPADRRPGGVLSTVTPLLTAVATAFLEAVRSTGHVGGGPEGVKKEKHKKAKKGRAGEGGAASGEGEPPAAALCWEALLAWMGNAEVEGAAVAMLSRVQQQGQVQEGQAGAWVTSVLLSTLRELLSRHGGMLSPGVLRPCCQVLAELVAQGKHSAADECLAALLVGPNRHAVLSLMGAASAVGSDPATQESLPAPTVAPGVGPLVDTCLQRPSAATAALLHALAAHSREGRERLAQRLPPLLLRHAQEQHQSRAGGGGSAVAPGESSGVLRVLACVLPAAVAAMRGPTLGQGSTGIAEAEASWRHQAADLAGCLHRPLLSFFVGKRTIGAAAPMQHVGEGRDTEGAVGGLGSAADVAAAGLATALHSAALPCLRLCLQWQPMETKARDRLLRQLLPPSGFSLEATALESHPVPQLGWATSAEKAQAAAVLFEAGVAGSGGLGGPDGGGCTDEAMLLQYVRTYAATLASMYKLQELSPAQQHLEAVLMQHLDGPLGDAVAALPAQRRSTADFGRMAEVACSLGTSVLRHRFGSESTLRMLRRFMAALLPDSTSLEDNDQERGSSERSTADAVMLSPPSSGSDGGGSSSEGSDSEGGNSTAAVLTRRRTPTGVDGSELGGDVELRNSAAAAACLQLLQRLMTHSKFVSALRSAAASPPPLPKAAQELSRPLQSLLPLAELPEGCLRSEVEGAAAAGVGVKQELCELVETLLDLQEQYGGKDTLPEVEKAEEALLPLLMAGYGASLSPADMAVWSLAQSINLRAWQRMQRGGGGDARARGDSPDVDTDTEMEQGGGDERLEEEGVCALLQGPLAGVCFAWGAAAAATVSVTASWQRTKPDTESLKKLLQSKLSLDPLRCALSAVHFPEWRLLLGQGASAVHAPAPIARFEEGPSSQTPRKQDLHADAVAERWQGDPCRPSSASSPAPWTSLCEPCQADPSGGREQRPSSVPPAQPAPPPLPHAEAGYDPAFLLPFCVVALRRRLLAPRALIQLGALSLCLRSLATADDALRGLAYEAVGLFWEQLDAEEFREKRQLSVLLTVLRCAVTSPFQRLPAVHALVCAEAALTALHPGCPMYLPVNKYLLRRAVMDLEDVPLFRQLMLGGAPQHVSQRQWLLQLLLGGLRGGEEARLYRRRYVLELAMSLHDASVGDPGVARLALRLVCRATYIPKAARHLATGSSLIAWLGASAARAAAAEEAGGEEGCAGRAAGSGELGWRGGAALGVEDALSALLRLTLLKAVVRPGARQALQDLTLATQQLRRAADVGFWEESRAGKMLSQLEVSVRSMDHAWQRSTHATGMQH